MIKILTKISMRLDVFLHETGRAESRTEAKNLILEGSVTVFGNVVRKPSYEIDEAAENVEINVTAKKFASRAGFKLEAALDNFNVSVEGKCAVDIGASSGGFTDCLLKRGCTHVFAVDSGYGQLVRSLREDERVSVYENYNARYMKSADFESTPDIAVMDVSFISATYIIPAVKDVLAAGGEFICLIKPQFEVGKAKLGKGGIVRNEKFRREAIDKVVSFAFSQGFEMRGVIESPITGGDGNIEYLAYFRKADSKE